MRILLKILLVFVSIFSFLAIGVFGAVYAYGAYGAPLVVEQLQKAEDQAEQELEDQYPGADITVDFQDVFYKLESGNVTVSIEIHAVAELADVEVENKTNYAVLDLMSVVMGGTEFETYDEAEWATMSSEFEVAPAIIFDGEQAKTMGMTYMIVSAAVFVTSIVVNAVFLRKRRHA